MKIDEPETPWASPPKELYFDDGDPTLPPETTSVNADDLAQRLTAAALAAAAAAAEAGQGEWESDEDRGRHVQIMRRQPDSDDDESTKAGALNLGDAEMRRRLFEAQRKNRQGRFYPTRNKTHKKGPNSGESSESEEEGLRRRHMRTSESSLISSEPDDDDRRFRFADLAGFQAAGSSSLSAGTAGRVGPSETTPNQSVGLAGALATVAGGAGTGVGGAGGVAAMGEDADDEGGPEDGSGPMAME